MRRVTRYDAVVVGSGPNGLAAAVELAQHGRSVLVREAQGHIGGGTRSAELTLPGFMHDVCSAVHPLAVASPFFRTLPLADHGLEWVHPPTALAHPFDDGTAALLERSIEATGASLGEDAQRYARLVEPFVARWEDLVADVLAPLRPSALSAARVLCTLSRFHVAPNTSRRHVGAIARRPNTLSRIGGTSGNGASSTYSCHDIPERTSVACV